jgi:hypothetical protein
MDSKKAPNVVKIGGRYYVKNNWSKTVDKSGQRLNDILKSLGKRVQKSRITQCTVETGGALSVYGPNDFKLLLDRANAPVGFILSGKPEIIEKDKFKDVPADFEEAVKKINAGEDGKPLDVD